MHCCLNILKGDLELITVMNLPGNSCNKELLFYLKFT